MGKDAPGPPYNALVFKPLPQSPQLRVENRLRCPNDFHLLLHFSAKVVAGQTCSRLEMIPS